MIKLLLKTIFLTLLSNQVFAIEVIKPQELQTSAIQIGDPDRHVKTLGTVDFKIDLSAAHDDLLALKVRRSSLTLKHGRSFSAFGIHKKAGIIVLAGGGVTHVSVASVDNVKGSADASVLFYGEDNTVISPRPEDVAVFDINFKPLAFSYSPLQTPGSLEIPIAIALDTSGSMDGHMSTVVSATRDFMRELPTFTRCRLLTFDDDVKHLTPLESDRLTSCPSLAYLLNTPLQAGGRTALHEAIYTGFVSSSHLNQSFPNITIIITDGENTVDFYETLEDLKITKVNSNSKLFVFWAGNYEKDYLQGLADLEFVSTQNLDAELDRFFHSLGVSISGLQTMHIRK